jgi:hypothetical protein
MGIVRLPVPTPRCPGYGIDHVKARKEGGADVPQTDRRDRGALVCAHNGPAGIRSRWSQRNSPVAKPGARLLDRHGHSYFV